MTDEEASPRLTFHASRLIMTESYDIQCPTCGTLYSEAEEVCPYCGQPRPDFIDDYPDSQTEFGLEPLEDYYSEVELPSPDATNLPPTESYNDEWLPEEAYYDDPADYPIDEGVPFYDNQSTGEWSEDGYSQPPDYWNTPYQPHDYQVAEAWSEDQEVYPDYANDSIYADESGWFEDKAEAAVAVTGPHRRRFTWWRLTLGCFGIFLCAGLLYGGIGVMAVYNGLQEQTAEKLAEAELHYQRGQELLTNKSLDRAIAEFELAMSLNPGLLEAREALREAKKLSQAQPTPTSETRSAAAASILAKVDTMVTQQNWLSATETLAQVRDLDPDYQPDRVSELMYTTNYNLGLQLLTPDQANEALLAFERALMERPDDVEATAQRTKVLLYVKGRAAEEADLETATKSFAQLYREDAGYLDVKPRLLTVYEKFGDQLTDQQDWCQAEAQYLEANRLQPDNNLQAKADTSNKQCKETVVTQAGGKTTPADTPGGPLTTSVQSTAITNSLTLTTTPAPANASASASSGSAGGTIYYSAYNTSEKQWEILSIPANGGTPKTIAINSTMPTVSPDGHWLIYHSELINAEGFHRLDLTNGEDTRVTLYQRHILPRFGGDNGRFVFVAQEPGTGRWQVQLGFIDGKSEPIILRDGRTPDWSPNGDKLAYQGTDPGGNNPGIYLVPFDGGESIRLTTHESDRAPDFSPDGSQLAYMSTQGGNWDIYTVSTAGGPPRQLTTSSGQDGLPVWSPDGSQIAYVSDTGGSWAIYIVSASGGAPVKVTPWDGVSLPDWLIAQIWWAK